MFGKYIKVHEEVWSAIVLDESNNFTDFCPDNLNVIFPSKVFISQHTKINTVIKFLFLMNYCSLQAYNRSA